MMEEGRLLLSALVPDGKDWVDVFAALATPIIAALAAMFAYRGYRLERRKREDELFDRRLAFFENTWNFILVHGAASDGMGFVDSDTNENTEYIGTDIGRRAIEARFLFGPDTERFIRQLPYMPIVTVPKQSERRGAVEPPSWLVDHFSHYLSLRP